MRGLEFSRSFALSIGRFCGDYMTVGKEIRAVLTYHATLKPKTLNAETRP